jgi:uncharacterized membrane protein YoaK (UPF0700 family)
MAAVFWNFQSILITCILYALTEAERRLVQSSWRSWQKSRVYASFIVWTLPMMNGALFGALAKNFPWPKELDSVSARVTYAVVLGLFCGAVYGRIKKFVETGSPPDPK